MTIDLEKVREDTLGCREVIHFNNAGAALMPKPVLEAIVRHLDLETRIGGYEAAEASHTSVEQTYDLAAGLINCRSDEIAVVENATRAWDMAFYSVKFSKGDKILTSMAEYAANFIAFLQVARRTGAQIVVIPNDASGSLDVDALDKAMGHDVKLIAISHVPTNGGLVNPAEEVGTIARKTGVLYLLDACQSVGQFPVDVQRIGCDMLSATGRKYLRGPRGTGFLYVNREVLDQLEPPFLDLHSARWIDRDYYEMRSDARRFETWETNYSTKIGLGRAIDYAMKLGLEKTWERIQALAGNLRSRLNDLPGVSVRDLGNRQCGIVSFTVEGRSPDRIREKLSEDRINVSVSPAEYTLLDMNDRNLSSVIRASVHYYNSEDEIDRFTEILSSIITT
jgi:cysteine desulfurase/selenocysteine lyase